MVIGCIKASLTLKIHFIFFLAYDSNLLQCLQIQGKYYFRIDPIGDGAKWRRTFGQEIYSPLLLAFTEEVKLFEREYSPISSLDWYISSLFLLAGWR